ARDALKDVVGHRRGDEPAVPREENVARAAFGDVAVLVQEDGFVVPVGGGFVARQNAVRVGARNFGAAGDGKVVHAAPADDTGFELLACGEVIAEGYGHDRVGVVVVGMDAN